MISTEIKISLDQVKESGVFTYVPSLADSEIINGRSDQMTLKSVNIFNQSIYDSTSIQTTKTIQLEYINIITQLFY